MRRLGLTFFVLAAIALVLFAVWKIQDMSPRHHFRLGQKALKERNYEEAIGRFSRVIHLDSRFPEIYTWRGLCYYARHEYDLALADNNSAIQLAPNNASNYKTRGNTWFAKKDFEQAIADYSKAIELGGRDAAIFYDRGESYWLVEDYDHAITDFNKALELNPNMALALIDRGLCYRAKKQYEHAKADLHQALMADPPNFLRLDQQNPWGDEYQAWLLQYLAWLLATCPDAKVRDGAKAVEYATKANELTAWKRPHYLGTLAAAYAEVGKFDEAVKWAKQGLEHPEAYSPGELEQDRQALKLYETRKPYREE
jgi:tetratricopeptide (TPR) repeat protein